MASPAAEGTLKLRTVADELSEVEHKTYKTYKIGIPHSKMQMFKKEEDMLSIVIDYWLSGNVEDVPVTWESLVTALQSKQVGEAGLAKDIAARFCSKEEKSQSDSDNDNDSESSVSSDTEPLSPSIEMDLQQKLSRNLKIIMMQYAAYIDRILMIAQGKGITAKRLRLYLLSLSASSDDKKKLQLLSGMEAELNKVDEVVDIFMLLNSKYASFLDYGIFEAILTQFGENEKHDELNYPSHLKAYIEMHKIKEFVKLNPRLSLKIDSNSEVIKMKFNIKKTQSLKSLKEVITAVADILEIQASVLRLYSIKRGCVLVSCLIYTSIANTIFTSEIIFTDAQKDKFRAASVLWLKYKGRKFDFKIPDGKRQVESVRKKLNKLYKASLDIDNITATPLHRAVESGNAESIQKLLEIKPEVAAPFLQTQLTVRDRDVKRRKKVIQKLHPEARLDLDIDSTKVGATRYHKLDEEEKLVNELVIESQEGSRMAETLPLSPKDVEKDTQSVNQSQLSTNTDPKKERNVTVTVAGNMTDSLEWPDVCEAPQQKSLSLHKNFLTDYAPEPFLVQVADKPKKRRRRRRRRRKNFEQMIISEDEHSQSALSTKAKSYLTIRHHQPPLCQDIDFPNSAGTTLHSEVVSQIAPYAAESRELIKIREQLRQPLSPIIECLDDSTEVTKIESHKQDQKISEQPLYDVNCIDSIGWTPLHYACAIGNLHIVRMLLSELKADITARDTDGRPPILLAALAGHATVVQVLLKEYWCSADTKDNDGHALIHYACAGGNPHLVQSLIFEHGIDAAEKNGQNNTPLHVAALCGQDEVAFYLIKKFGCDTMARGWVGRSLLHKACAGGNVNLVQTLLLEHNADINARDVQDNTPLHVAVLCGNDDVALTLITEFRCDPNVRGHNGDSLLHKACMREDASFMQTLIRKHNADINAKNDFDNTPLHVAALHGNENIVLTLINEYNCDTKVKGEIGRSLLHMVCSEGNVNLVRTLIREHNADTNARDYDNNTPLHVAALAGHEEVVETLITEFGCEALKRT